MCICVNCRHISKCQRYLFIEKQHRNNTENYDKIFVPANNLIQINILNQVNHCTFDWDLVECLSFLERPGAWLN